MESGMLADKGGKKNKRYSIGKYSRYLTIMLEKKETWGVKGEQKKVRQGES